MSSFSRRTFLLAPLAFAACGFEPVYGTGGNAQNLRGKISFATPTDQDSFNLNAQLEQQLGRPQAPQYDLKITTETTTDSLAITGSNDIERFNITGDATYSLTKLGTKTEVLSGNVNTFTAYSASLQPVATLAAQRDATRRLMIALADKITADLLIKSDQL
jgi:LPS-assembly lipoprotein